MRSTTSPHSDRPGRAAAPRTRGVKAAAAAALVALTLVLGACAPSIRIEAEFPATTVFTVRPQSSGVLLFVRVPASRPSGGIHVERSRGRTFHIPPGHYPPPGQCRVWNPDLPPGRQSKPGPCHRLERRVPPGSILIYG